MAEKLKLIVFGILIGLLSAGLILIIASPSRGSQITLLPTPERSNLTVFITGEVQNSGVYQLPETSRIEDAITSAGGWTASADREAVNLAAHLEDGQAIFIPSLGETEISVPAIERSGPLTAGNRIDINTASVEELDTLPGIGLAKAEDIIAYRQKNGAFDTIEDILDVPGIGPGLFENIKDLITTSNYPIGN